MYDLIGDIHGHADALGKLLFKMDYKQKNGVWQHCTRSAIFVGDYIDRGPAIRDSLRIVRSMVENSNAIALMGNHEYNALAYAYQLPHGTYLRKHNEKNTSQHKATLDQFKEFPAEWKSYLDWFYTLPLFLEKDGLRAVHACWDPAHIDWLKERGQITMSESFLVDSHQKNSTAYKVINDILKGKEFDIPSEYAWKDKDGNTRKENRYKWWLDPINVRYGEFLFNCPAPLEEQMIGEQIQVVVYPEDAPPVFFGHYWLEDAFPVIQRGNVICLDYSVAKEGYLVAYRWNGEKQLNDGHFVYVKDAD